MQLQYANITIQHKLRIVFLFIQCKIISWVYENNRREEMAKNRKNKRELMLTTNCNYYC